MEHGRTEMPLVSRGQPDHACSQFGCQGVGSVWTNSPKPPVLMLRASTFGCHAQQGHGRLFLPTITKTCKHTYTNAMTAQSCDRS